MKNKSLLVLVVLCFCFMLFGCQTSKNALSVVLTDITTKDSTIRINYEQEEDYKNKYTDILIKSNQDNQKLKVALELDVYCCIKLEQKDKFYSLSQLIANAKIVKTEYEKYDDAVSKTYIFNSQNDVKLNFVAVVGELNENTNSLVNTFNVSKELTLEVKKT